MKTNVIKRITGAVLAAVLGTAALTGCGAGNSSTASTSTSKDESGATESKTSSATTESTASASGEKKTVIVFFRKLPDYYVRAVNVFRICENFAV